MDDGVEWLYHNRSIQSVEWVTEQGVCLDNLVEGQSQIKQAGRGAFAKRIMEKGTVVAALPMVHLPNRDKLVIYGETVSEDGVERDLSRPIHHQLLLNYCFGHRDADLLLCPYGVSTSLVNHSREKANVRLEWSKTLTQHPEWFNQTPSKWSHSESAGLAMELVATRDIAVGEEIYFDYGEEWETAWDEHVASWSPDASTKRYKDATELNSDMEIVLSTVDEDWLDLRESVTTFCRGTYLAERGFRVRENPPNEDARPRYRCRIVDRYERNGEIRYNAEYLAIGDDLVPDDETEELLQTQVDVRGIAFELPRDAFLFEPSMYSKDFNQPWSFRHDIRIPDRLFPDAWKVKTQSESSAFLEQLRADERQEL